MANLIANIWKAPGSTVAGGLIAALAFIQAAEVEIPAPWLVGLGAVAAFLGAFTGNGKKP